MYKSRLQFLHHKEVFSNRNEAIDWLNHLDRQGIESLEGEPITVKYVGDNGMVQTIIAIGRDGEKGEGNTSKYHYIDTFYLESKISSTDSDLKSLIESETERATNAESSLQSAIDNEELARINADTILTDNLNQEIQDRKDDVDEEESRAISRENEIEVALNNEIERAKAEEKRNKVYSTDKTILITESTDGTNIETNIDNATLKKDVLGVISSQIKIKEVPMGERPESSLTAYKLVDGNGTYLSDSALISIPKVSDLVDVKIIEEGGKQFLEFTYNLSDGTQKTVKFDVGQILVENEFKDGLEVVDIPEGGKVVKVKIDNTTGSEIEFLKVSSNGVRLEGVKNAIQIAVNNEESRAKESENNLKDLISAEEERATIKENDLFSKINTEVSERNAAISEEKSRAIGAETVLQTAIDNEVTLRNAAILTETQRAQSAEESLLAKITQEAIERDAAINVEKSRAEVAEEQLSANLIAEKTERDAAIAEETANRKAADDILDASLSSLEEKVTELKTNLYGNDDNSESIKHIILTDTVIGSMVTSEPSVNQSLLRKVNGKFYASNNASDMLYKGSSLEGIIENLIISSGSSESEIIELKEAMALATTRIETLEANLTAVSSELMTLKETMAQTIKDTVAAILKGTDYEIKVDTADSNNIKIGFADNAIFGPII